MRLSPAPPSDLSGLVDAYEQTARAVLELGRACPPEWASDPTPCPGWDVFDQVAHVESVDAALSGEKPPEVDLGERPHVRNDFGVRIERLLESRRHLSLPEVCDQLEGVISKRVALYRSVDETTPLPSPFGMTPAKDLITLRSFDIWSHEQDLRETLGLPGNLDSPAAVLSMQAMYASLDRIAVAAGIAVDQTVVVELTGPVTGRGAVQVVDQDGKLRGVPTEVDNHEALCVLQLDTRAAGRFVAGRQPLDGGPGTPWVGMGDHDALESLIRHFAITP